MEVRQTLIDLWDSPHWRWWTLLAGILLVAATALLGLLVSVIIDHEAAALTLLGLLAEIVVISIIGGGFLDTITRRMSRGGLARETADIDEMRELKTGRRRLTEAEVQRRDRKAIRSGILVLPVLVTFVILLFTR